MAAVTPDLPQVESAIIAYTNDFRRENKLETVKPNPVLAAAAKAFAAYLARTNSFSHTADGRQPGERAKGAGYDYCQIAENLAFNRNSRGFTAPVLAREVVEGWKNSPSHRKNMLATHVTEIGVGVAKGDGHTYLSVQLFGRPERLKYQFRIENLSVATVGFTLDDKPESLEPRVSVRFTRCEPATLTFETATAGGSERRLQARYRPRDGDRFTVSGGTLGAVEIEHGR